MNAFEQLTPKAEANEAKEKAHRITADVKVVDGQLVLSLPIAEIGKSKKSNGEKGAIGFMFNPVTFEQGGYQFVINPGWTTLTAAK